MGVFLDKNRATELGLLAVNPLNLNTEIAFSGSLSMGLIQLNWS